MERLICSRCQFAVLRSRGLCSACGLALAEQPPVKMRCTDATDPVKSLVGDYFEDAVTVTKPKYMRMRTELLEDLKRLGNKFHSATHKILGLISNRRAHAVRVSSQRNFGTGDDGTRNPSTRNYIDRR